MLSPYSSWLACQISTFTGFSTCSLSCKCRHNFPISFRLANKIPLSNRTPYHVRHCSLLELDVEMVCSTSVLLANRTGIRATLSHAPLQMVKRASHNSSYIRCLQVVPSSDRGTPPVGMLYYHSTSSQFVRSRGALDLRR